ncbi:phage head completion protein [Roseobacter sp. CCS2]|uniref:phage head completion protein n=1 Tax=Roseobacter sp. CCS2 TaxID=391593 RepID=UPI0000F3C5EA|nr:head-tail adaptor protein [Roseobacter sp. CCS2]EBA11790.1 hypothetical protein RCCS2_17716 [Roseobacter sp. CCS2]
MKVLRHIVVRFERMDRNNRDVLNAIVPAWVPLGTSWAGRSDISDAEKTAAGNRHSVLMARFVVHSNPITRALTGADRMVEVLASGERIWEIAGIKNATEGRRPPIEITATRTPPPEPVI